MAFMHIMTTTTITASLSLPTSRLRHIIEKEQQQEVAVYLVGYVWF